VLERVGDKWSLLVIGLLGEGPLRFGALRRSVDGISCPWSSADVVSGTG
jgi:DNA-binding HxlR family transcriptional regulator